MNTANSGPCNWPVSYDFCKTNGVSALEGLDDDLKEMVLQAATDYLWHWSGRTFGTCPVTVRPCREGCSEIPTFWASPADRSLGLLGYAPVPDTVLLGAGTPALVGPVEDDTLVGFACGSCDPSSRCGCSDETRYSLRLPGPIAKISEVKIDGQVLPFTSYRVDDYQVLVRTDGGVWPACQDLSLDSSQQGTWEVTYLRGRPVPTGGQIAAGVLATEMAKQLCGDNDCQLPQRVQSVTRQGVTMMMLDNMDNLDKGFTGIWLIDSWLSSVTKPPRAGRVFSVDVPRNRFRRATS